jgi:hypothetical protein
LTQIDVALYPALTEAAFVKSGGGGVRSRMLFDLLQDRHLPITPNLSRALAEFEAAPAPAAAPYWGRAYVLADASIGLAGKMGNTAPWGALFATFLQAVVEPVLRHAAARAGVVSLTVIGAGPLTSPQQDWDSACQTTEDHVARALDTSQTMGDAFWIGAGVALLGAFRQQMSGRLRARGSKPSFELPFLPDLALAQAVYAIEPTLEVDPLWRKLKLRPNAKSKRLRVGTRPREGGVEGVLHTRRVRDIPDALPSAFVVPKEFRLFKLLEDGFMITHRPPYRRPSRDLLSLTMQTREADALEAAALVKAAWVDACTRLRIVLANLAMTKSELGYGHIRTSGTIAAAMSLEAAPLLRGLDAMALAGPIRRNAISISPLFPEIFETLVSPVASEREVDPSREGVAAAIKVRAACSAKTAQAAKPGDASRRAIARPEDYARVCLIEISPRVVRQDETVLVNWRSDRRQIGNQYGFDQTKDLFCGLVLCPPEVAIGARFVVCADDGQPAKDIMVPEAETAADAIAKTIGALSGWMITQNVLAAVHG